jgi:hypothetical protein
LIGLLCKKIFFRLDNCIKINYDAAQDRGARFISKLPNRDAAYRRLKGDIAEAEMKAAALLFAGPTENIRRTVTQVERYRVQKSRMRFPKGPKTDKNVFCAVNAP